MCSRKQYLDWVCPFLVARAPRHRDPEPHELLFQVLCRRKGHLPQGQLADLIRNITNGPPHKRVTTRGSRRRQCGGMEAKTQREPTDAEVVFGSMVKLPPPFVTHTGWGISRIEWLHKLERQRRYIQPWQEPPGVTRIASGMSMAKPTNKDGERSGKKEHSQARSKLPGCWALLPFACGWGLGLPSDPSCLDVSDRKKSS